MRLSLTIPARCTNLDSLGSRIMQKVQYRKVGSAESLWVVNSARTSAALMAPLWAQLDVTGGTIATDAGTARYSRPR